MSQFDFFIISKLTVIFASFVVFIAFFIFFSLVVPTWLVKMVRILFKCELIAETKRFAALVARHNASIFAALLSLDMLEQFLLKVGFFFGVFFYIVAFILPIAFSSLIFSLFLLEMLLNFVASVIHDVTQDEAISSSRDLVGLATVFLCVVTANMLGILPFAFTVTSGLAAPFLFSLTVFFAYFFILVTKFRLNLFAGFLPAGTNLFIAPLIILIEVVSTIAKFASLGIRLFANMFAGHLLLKVFYSIAFQIVAGLTLFLALSEALVSFLLFAIIALEIMIAFLQSFVMLLLTVLYFKEAENFIYAH